MLNKLMSSHHDQLGYHHHIVLNLSIIHRHILKYMSYQYSKEKSIHHMHNLNYTVQLYRLMSIHHDHWYFHHRIIQPLTLSHRRIELSMFHLQSVKSILRNYKIENMFGKLQHLKHIQQHIVHIHCQSYTCYSQQHYINNRDYRYIQQRLMMRCKSDKQ